jgi:hypothetical protein
MRMERFFRRMSTAAASALDSSYALATTVERCKQAEDHFAAEAIEERLGPPLFLACTPGRRQHA